MFSSMHRRSFLTASGVSLALPLLESMNPAFARSAVKPAKRMVFICTTLGLHPQSLWPETPGDTYETTEYLALLKEHRHDFTLFSGLSHEGQAGRQPHNSEMTWLTAARGPGLDGFRNTISVDQLAAREFGYVTRFPSITLSSNSASSQSFTENGVMLPAETSPANLFAELFLAGNEKDVARQKQALQDGRSVLDQLLSQSSSLRRRASANDSRQLDEYFESIREAEKGISEAEGWLAKPKPKMDQESPQDVSDKTDLVGRVRLLMEMIPLIVQTDSSRVISIMIQDHRTVPRVEGVSAEHHNLSHHGQDNAKIEQLKRIEKELLKQFGGLLKDMKSKTEGNATLLDRTTVLFGSNLGNANSHDTRNLPILLAGGGFNHGRYVSFADNGGRPLSNLFVQILRESGIGTEAFGQSSGPLSW